MTDFLRPTSRAMPGYVPGERPNDRQFIKLNTNENPYPPSPKVLDAIRGAWAGGDLLRKYPDPLGTMFRRTAGRLLGIDPESILIGNGSDDILTIITRAFVPEKGLVVSPTPSYVLYETLGELQGARFHPVPYFPDWQIPLPWPNPEANLTFIASPNSPSGTTTSVQDLERLAEELSGPLVVDEAYVDFAEEHALSLAIRGKAIVTRSLSKSYSLAGIRFGYAVADPALVKEFVKVKDSYNCDALTLIAATAALEDQESLRETRSRILATRIRLSEELVKLGFEVCPSQANFVWTRRASGDAPSVFEHLRQRKILVRYMAYEGYGDGLRISIGSYAGIHRLLMELETIV